MSGIYIHIPYCRKACTYCNFHFSTNFRSKEKLLKALITEIGLQNKYLPSNKINTIYFGGGTPSVLEKDELNAIMDALRTEYDFSSVTEVTLETNPDDFSEEAVESWKEAGINRLSIGVQSFQEKELNSMNRSHNAQQAIQSVQLAKKHFGNISLDLIYGSNETSNEDWNKNLDQFFELSIPHLSAYALTVEPKTALAHQIETGITLEPSEEKTIRQFEILMDRMEQEGYEHYEISNFSLSGKNAVHNSNYWNTKPYLGLGPAAHSFNGQTRQWNPSNNSAYIKSLEENKVPAEIETLSPRDQFNEHIMTRLRTQWGVNLPALAKNFDTSFHEATLKILDEQVALGNVEKEDDDFRLTRKGKFIADSVIASFFQ